MKYLKKLHNKSKLPPRSISTIKKFHSFSTEKIAFVRLILQRRLKRIKCEGDFCAVAVGSYGRYEASEQSDLDVYVIHSKNLSSEVKDEINKIIRDTAKKSRIKCSRGFKSVSLDSMYRNIGGNRDTNPSITNRILFLLESECLYNEAFFNDAYEKILKKYLKDVMNSDQKPPRFLFSDIIRYYRTICVDYEFKTTEGNKEWAIRNVKLRFSRKGLYFGGIIVLLNSLNVDSRNRYDYIVDKLRMPFAEKISHILCYHGIEDKYKDILVLYADFMKEIGEESVMRHLDQLAKDNRREDKTYSRLTDMSAHFNAHLLGLLSGCTWGEKRNYQDFLVL